MPDYRLNTVFIRVVFMFTYKTIIGTVLNLLDVKVKQSDCLSDNASHRLMLL